MGAFGRVAVATATVLGVCLCVGLAVAGGPPQKSIRDGVFNAAQVETGKQVFTDVCSECHTSDTFGPDYMDGWEGATVGEFYAELEATMPYESPGTLKGEEYASVVVYLFSINGVTAGEAELPADVSALYDINIEGPFTWNGSKR